MPTVFSGYKTTTRKMNLVNRLLRKNTSPARIAGFVLSNIIGLAIIIGGVQFYEDAAPIWEEEDSFITTDYLVVNKKVGSTGLFGDSSAGFSSDEIADIRKQPWVREVGAFSSTDYKVWASVNSGGKGMSTMMFFESIPDRFVDVSDSRWQYTPGQRDVPVIISKDYLTLYNFGFASSAGMPKLTEQLMGGIPLELDLAGENGQRMTLTGHIVGFSNRLNTILVPEDFMKWSNTRLGSGNEAQPSRLIIDVKSPGDVAIAPYLEENNMEMAGDKNNSSASFLLRVVVGVVLAIGIVITLLSLFILMLSVSLLIEKNRDKLHTLLMLGYPLSSAGRPYEIIITVSSVISLGAAWMLALTLRRSYLPALKGLGSEGGGVIVPAATGIAVTLLVVAFNILAVRHRVKDSWRIRR